MKIELTLAHINEVLEKPLLIGNGYARDGSRKRFWYHPYSKQFRLEVAGYGGSYWCNDIPGEVEELLKHYNDL